MVRIRETQNKCLTPAITPGNRSIFGHVRTAAAFPGVPGPSRGPSGRPRGTQSPRPPPGGRHGDPRNSACLPALAHTGRLALAGRAGMRTRPPSRCRGSAPSRSRGSAWRSGRGACPRAHGGLGSAPPRARPTGPAVRPRAWRGPSRRASRPRRGAGPSGPPRAWRRPASPRRRGRGRRRPSPGGTSCRGATGCPSWPGASRGRASPTRSRAGRAPPRS